MVIHKCLIGYNFSRRRERILYLVLHDTGNYAKGADAMAHFRYFNAKNRNASAHYFVDDSKVVQLVEDDKAAWHCGDGRGRFGITNQNSIGVEICVNSDGVYQRALENTRILVRLLMERHGIPMERVVRHFDASHKLCPASMSGNSWEAWWKFKESL